MGPAVSGPAAVCATGSSTVQCKGGIHEQRKLSCGTTAAQGRTGAVGVLSTSNTLGGWEEMASLIVKVSVVAWSKQQVHKLES